MYSSGKFLNGFIQLNLPGGKTCDFSLDDVLERAHAKMVYCLLVSKNWQEGTRLIDTSVLDAQEEEDCN